MNNMDYEEKVVIKDARVLAEQFIPRLISHRDGQISSLRDALNPILEGQNPKSTVFFGEPGVGKTCVARYVLDDLSSHTTSFLHSYVNCWLYQSRYTILFNILRDFGKTVVAHRKGTPTDELLEALRECLKGKKAVIILDEADQIEDEKIFYDLIGLEGLGLILISNMENIFYNKDPRIVSRFASASMVEFPRYSTDEIIDILKSRVDWGMVPGSIRQGQLETIADLSEGDARAAIGMLKAAAEAAENEGKDSVEDCHIISSKESARDLIINQRLESLNQHQRILLDIIRGRASLRPADLYEEYSKTCRQKAVKAMGDRMLRIYLLKMVKYGLIRTENEGRWRVYRKV